MQPNDPTRPSINPRQVIEARGVDALAELLAATGYIVPRRILTDLKHSLRSRKPLLIEGPRGGGKTGLAEALAEACNLTTFYLQGTEELTLADLLYSWDREEQREFVREERERGTPVAEIRARKWARQFLTLGEALGAFAYAAQSDVPPIFILDEVDKLTAIIEDMLLQLLGRGFASVPRLEGTIGVTEKSQWPIVILLSNNIRHELSEPLRSRCIYCWMEPPTAREEVLILRRRVPAAPAHLLAGVVKITGCIRLDMPQVRDKPGLREAIDLLSILTADGVERLTEETIEEYLAFLGKKQKELFNLRHGLARLEEAAGSSDEKIDGWVAEAFADRSDGETNED